MSHRYQREREREDHRIRKIERSASAAECGALLVQFAKTFADKDFAMLREIGKVFASGIKPVDVEPLSEFSGQPVVH